MDRTSGDFDGIGHSIPSELFPEEIYSEGILFKLGPKDGIGNNTLVCEGDTIMLTQGNFNQINILAASTRDTYGTFKVDDKTFNIGIHYYSGFIGQWSSLNFNNKVKPVDFKLVPSFLKKDNIAWVGTHRHDVSGINGAYIYCYLYKYSFDITEGAKTLILPHNDKIRIMVITLSNNHNSTTHPVSNFGIGLNGQ